MKHKIKTIAFLALAATTLAACGNPNSNKGEQVDKAKFPLKTSNTGKAIEGATFEVGIVNDSPFSGLFSPVLTENAVDDTFNEPTGGGELLDYDETGKIIDGGPADFKLDIDKKVGTITLRKDLKWSDGKPVTADDYIFTYQFISDKDYTGVRYSDLLNVKGVEDYHDGKATSISGLKKVDDYTVEITFLEVSPSTLQIGGDVVSYLVPKHQLESVPVKDAASSDAVRKNPLSFGPFYISKVVTGETVELSVNPYYYGNKPKIEKIIEKNVNSKSIIQALQAKEFDYVEGIPTSSYDKYQNTKGYEFLGKTELSYSYLGFKLGKFDEEKAINIYDKNAKMANKSLRQAMGYALDMDKVGEKFYHGLRTNANSLLVPRFGDLYASKEEVPGYYLDVKKANKLLDDAGYKDVDGDKLREDPKGNKLTINFAFMSGGDIAEPLSQYYIQQWKNIGLDVKLTNGRLLEFNTFYQKVQEDDPEIDIFMAAWSLSLNPEPSNLFGEKTSFNYSRFVSDEQNKLIKNINSEKAFDDEYRKKEFLAWQKYASEEAFVIPVQYRYSVYPVSERVTGLDITPGISIYKHYEDIGITSEKR